MTNKTKAILGLALAAGGVLLYTRMSPEEKEKFRKSFTKNGTNYLIQLLSFGLGRALPTDKADQPVDLAKEPLAQANGQSNAAMIPSAN